MVPSFISLALAERVLQAGKSINFIRHCGSGIEAQSGNSSVGVTVASCAPNADDGGAPDWDVFVVEGYGTKSGVYVGQLIMRLCAGGNGVPYCIYIVFPLVFLLQVRGTATRPRSRL